MGLIKLKIKVLKMLVVKQSKKVKNLNVRNQQLAEKNQISFHAPNNIYHQNVKHFDFR
jgi:hypothetical protein